MNYLPDVIIAGVQRCGTTSLFRYLASHPEIQASSKKELAVFYENEIVDIESANELYKPYYISLKDSEKIKLEASPHYMLDPENISKKISEILPRIKIIIMLRNPVDRIYSVYKAYKRSQKICESVSFDQFILASLQSKKIGGIVKSGQEDLLNELERGRYDIGCRYYAEQFPADQLHIAYLEDLEKEPVKFMKEISGFIGINEEFYNDFVFSVENPSHTPRWPMFYRAALNINVALEKPLNKAPLIRKFFRSLHHKINSTKDSKISPETREKLVEYYSSRKST